MALLNHTTNEPQTQTTRESRHTINRSTTTADNVAAALREEILRGIIEAETGLKQDKIASRFNVSTIPVREALFQLADEGLVEFIPNRGAFVSSISADELRELFIIRDSLEILAFEKSLPNITDEDLIEAERVLEKMDAESDMYAWGELHWQFHALLYKPAQMPRLQSMLRSLHVNLIRYLVTRTIRPEIIDCRIKIEKEHRKLLDACWAKDIDIARIYMRRHLGQASNVLVDIGEPAQKPKTQNPQEG